MKALTKSVTLSDGTTWYYAVESYVMFCLIRKVLSNESSTATWSVASSSSPSCAYYNSDYDYIELYHSSDTSGTNYIQDAVLCKLDEILAADSIFRLTDTNIAECATTTVQDSIQIIPNIRFYSSSCYNTKTYSVADIVKYSPTFDKSSSSYEMPIASVIPAIHGYIRYKIALLDDESYKSLLTDFESCIKKTLQDIDIDTTNEAIQSN